MTDNTINITLYNPDLSFTLDLENYNISSDEVDKRLEQHGYDAEKNNIKETIAYSAARNGDIKTLNDIIELGVKNLDYIAWEAVEGGHLHIVEAMIKRGVSDILEIAANAAYYGHLHIIEAMIKESFCDPNHIAALAARGGHLHIIKAMVKLGARDFNTMIRCAKEDHQHHIVDSVYVMYKDHESDEEMTPFEYNELLCDERYEERRREDQEEMYPGWVH